MAARLLMSAFPAGKTSGKVQVIEDVTQFWAGAETAQLIKEWVALDFFRGKIVRQVSPQQTDFKETPKLIALYPCQRVLIKIPEKICRNKTT